MRRAVAIHRIEYAVISAVLIGLAVLQSDRLGWAFWILLLAPDLFGFVPAMFLGRAPARGHLPPRGVVLYNVWHTPALPLALGAAALLVPHVADLPFVANPWPLLGWLLHITVDRTVGYGLRGDDGGQAVF